MLYLYLIQHFLWPKTIEYSNDWHKIVIFFLILKYLILKLDVDEQNLTKLPMPYNIIFIKNIEMPNLVFF